MIRKVSKMLIPRRGYPKIVRLLQRIAFRLTNLMVGILPDPEKLKLREKMSLTGLLDYPRATIVMSVENSIQQSRLTACRKEPETIEWIERMVSQGDVFYDIGANVGAYTFVAYAATHGNLLVYAFEPSFSTYNALCRNVFLNDCQEKVIPFNIALSNKTALLTLHFSDISPGAALHSLTASDFHMNSGSPFVQQVLSYRLDDFISEFDLKEPNHIKIDVDGSELHVLQGACETLSCSGVKSIMVEIDRQQDSTNETERILLQKGFELVSRHPRVWNPQIANCVFVRRG
jgi:FkbM family methyltransferase